MSPISKIIGPVELRHFEIEFDEKSGRSSGASSFTNVPNVGLLWQRYMPSRHTGNKKWNADGALDWFLAVSAASCNDTHQQELLKALAIERRKALERCHATTFRRYAVRSPIVIGTSNSATIENAGVNLHHTHGFPVLPGASIKGVLHHFLTDEWDNTLFLPDDERLKDIPTMDWSADRIFGDDGTDDPDATAGIIAFHDAWPTMENIPCGGWLERDVLTVHHTEYYSSQGKRTPDDTEKTEPHSFLRLKKGTIFEFPLGFTPVALCWPQECRELLLVGLWELATAALHEAGIGAKVNAGYGRLLQTEELPK